MQHAAYSLRRVASHSEHTCEMRYSVQRAAHNRPVPADHHRWAEPTSVVVASRRQARRTEQPTRLVLRRHQVAHLLPRLQPDTAIIPVACVNAYVNNRSTCRGTTGPTAQFDLRGCVPASGSAHVFEWCGVRASPPAHRVCSCTHAMIGSGCVRVHVLLQHPACADGTQQCIADRKRQQSQ